MKSNLDHWKQLQQDGYFDKHAGYSDRERDLGQEDAIIVARFIPLETIDAAVVIGCGYGRESVSLGRAVKRLYGIDVSEKILATAKTFLADHGVPHFQPVLAERFAEDIPNGIDLVYSCVVMQHLTRDLVQNYWSTLAPKLSTKGRFVVQFLQHLDNAGTDNAELQLYEPSVNWSASQIAGLLDSTGLVLDQIMTNRVTKTALWHWVVAKRAQ